MGLTIGSRRIADVRIQSVTLRPLIGAYELMFGLYISVLPDDGASESVRISGARVNVQTANNQRQSLGFALPEGALEIETKPHPNTMTPGLYMTIQPGQVAALETLRGTGSIEFELEAVGTGVGEHGKQPVQDSWRTTIPKSEWIEKLRTAKARNILLLEVPLPFPTRSRKWANVAKSLQIAEEQFHNGDYGACVGSCRTVMEELGQQQFKKKNWAAGALDRPSVNRSDMTSGEREALVWAAVRHYAHLAHHGPSEGGMTGFSRVEAQFVLTATAAAVASAQAG